MGSARTFPSVAITSSGNIEVYFPTAYFEYMDEAARWMNLRVPFRQALALSHTFPQDDLSTYFHLIWSRWILLHEVGHVICGHLGSALTKEFIEFPILDSGASKVGSFPMSLRKAMEVDADVFAAHAMFRTFGSISTKGIGMIYITTANPSLTQCKILR